MLVNAIKRFFATRMENARRRVMRDVIQNLPFVDPDSSRMIEFIWACRQHEGVPTYADIFDIPGNTKADFGEMLDYIEHLFGTCFYRSPYLFRGLSIDHDRMVVDFYVVIEKTGSSIAVNAFGDKDKVDALIADFKAKYVEPKAIKVDSLIAFSDQGPVVDSVEMLENEHDLSTDAFYPWLEEGIDAFVKGYLASKSNVLVLVGPPGTGKSTFLRTLLFKIHRKNNGLANSEAVLLDPRLLSWLRSLGNEAVIGVEDADRLVSAREAGNHQMAGLLNFAEGVVKNNSKFIISTNLGGTSLIDPALVRPGRAYKVLSFRLLTADEANKARLSIGKEAADLDPNEKYTLSEALNFESQESTIQRRVANIGFVGTR